MFFKKENNGSYGEKYSYNQEECHLRVSLSHSAGTFLSLVPRARVDAGVAVG